MRLPVYGPQQVEPSSVPSVRVEPMSTGQGQMALAQGVDRLAEGADRLSDSLLAMQRLAKHKADATWAANAAQQLQHDTNTALLGNQGGTDVAAGAPAGSASSSDPSDTGVGHATPTGPSQQAVEAVSTGTAGLSTKGLLNEQGQAAARYSGPTYQFLAQRSLDIAKDAPSDEAREMYQRMASAHLEDSRATIEHHTAQQIQAAQESSLKGATALALKGIASNYADGVYIEKQLGGIEPLVKSLSRSPEEARAQIAAVREKAYSTVLNQFIANKDWKGAQDVFAQHKSELGEQAPQFEHTIVHLRDVKQGEDLAASIVAGAHIQGSVAPEGAKAGDSGLIDTGKAIRDFEALPQEKRTPEAYEAFSKHIHLADEGNRATAARTFSDSFSAYLQNHSLSDVPAPLVAWMKDNDPEGWHRLEQTDQQWKTEHARAAKGEKSPYASAFDLNYARLVGDVHTHWDDYRGMTFDQFARSYADKLKGEDFRKAWQTITERQSAVAKPGSAMPELGDKVAIGLMNESGIVPHNKSGEPVGDPTKLGGDAALSFGKLHDAASDFRQQFKAGHGGKEPGADDYRQALAPLMAKVRVTTDRGFIWDSHEDVPAVRYSSSAKYEGKEFSVPDDEAAQIAKDLEAAGVDKPSPDDIREAYVAKHGIKDRAPESPKPQASRDLKYDPPSVRRVLGPQTSDDPDFKPVGMPTVRAKLVPPPPTPTKAAEKPAAKKSEMESTDEAARAAINGVVDENEKT